MMLWIRKTLRGLWRDKSFTAISLGGLVVATASAVMIVAYVQTALHWDQLGPQSDRVYRVVMHTIHQGLGEQTSAASMPPLGPALQDRFSDIQLSARYIKSSPLPVRQGDKTTNLAHPAFVDSTFLQLFPFPLIYGDPETALNVSDGILLREDVAKRYFGDKNPVGEFIDIMGDCKVTGVYQIPSNGSHLNPEALFPISAHGAPAEAFEYWGRSWLATYVMLAKGVPAEQAISRLAEIDELATDDGSLLLDLQPLDAVHLESGDITHQVENFNQGSRLDLTLLISVGLALLLLSSLNFANLSTARALARRTDWSIHRVLGAGRGRLAMQAVGETLFLTTIAIALSLLLAKLTVPGASTLTGQVLILHLTDPILLSMLAALLVFVALVSAHYPLFVSSQAHLELQSQTTVGAPRFGRLLVAIQMAVCVMLLFGLTGFMHQYRFLTHSDLGYRTDEIINIHASQRVLRQKGDFLLNELRAMPGVAQASITPQSPIGFGNQFDVVPEGTSKSDNWIFEYMLLDGEALTMFDLELVQGRFYSDERAGDTSWDPDHRGSVLLNEEAVKRLGWTNPIGKQIEVGAPDVGTVVGVVRDFHNYSLREAIPPMVLFDYPAWNSRVLVRFEPGDHRATLANIEALWQQEDGAHPFRWEYIDQALQSRYMTEQRLINLMSLFVVVGLVVALFGIVGLTGYAVQRRQREIAVRKVLGASEIQIHALLGRSMIWLVGFGTIIGMPLGVYGLSRWQEQFAYHASSTIWTLSAPIVTLLIAALLTTYLVARRAAQSNPTKVLRS
ncbi:ABC transporter permease [bacterium]|nr:ABC transporter permease [bacterium]